MEVTMKTLMQRSRYVSLVAVITLLLAFFAALLWGVARSVAAAYEIFTTLGQSSSVSLLLIKAVDAFLIAIVLYILAASIYSLFIDDPGLPPQLVARNLSELKSKLSGVIVLVLVVRFAEYLFEELLAPQDVLWLGLAVAVVGAMLVAFGRTGSQDHGGKDRKA
jgi:uncharacterized membrane protein YqhA